MINVADLGMTQEELQTRVVDSIVNKFLETTATDEDGQEYVEQSPFAVEVRELVRRRIDERVENLCEHRILPHISSLIETITLQATNEWGEKRGEPTSFVEHLVARAESYLQEEVDYEGRTKRQRDIYGWKADQTRLCHIVHKHLHYSIETAMKNAVNVVNSQLVPALTEAAKMKLAEIAKTLQVVVTTK